MYLSWFTFAYNTKHIRRNNTLIKTVSIADWKRKDWNLCSHYWTDLSFPSCTPNDFEHGSFQRCSCCGSSQFTWYYLLIIIRYNQLLIEEKLGKINVSDRNPRINLVVSMQLVNKMLGLHKWASTVQILQRYSNCKWEFF